MAGRPEGRIEGRRARRASGGARRQESHRGESRVSKPKLRVAQVITGLVLGGGGQVMWTIARNFDRSQFEIDVFCIIGGGELVADIEGLGVPVRIIPAYDGASVFRYRPGGVLELARALRAGNYDLVHTHLFQADLIGGVAARLAGIRRVVKSLHNMGAWKKPYHLVGERLFAGRAERVICCSHYLSETAIRQEHLDPARVVTIHHGVDVARFQPRIDRGAYRESLGLDPSARVIGTIGRPIREKGHKYLLEAVPAIRAAHPDVQILIVGEGPLRPELETWARAHGLETVVRFAGARADIPELLGVMDVFAFPSVMEGLGIAVLEAMASRVPVITSDIQPLSEIVRNGENGLLVEAKNAAALASAVNALLDDPARADRLRQQAFADVVSHFSERQMVAEHERVYRELCSAH
jgi:glycosyltransferase involved in cell wall biosynthesis